MERKILIGIAVAFLAVMIVFTFTSQYTARALLPVITAGEADRDGWVDSSAVHYDESGKAFVYWVVPKETILGEALVLSRYPIRVKATKGKKIQAKGAEQLNQIALRCNREMEDGMKVRLDEEEK